MKFLNRNEQSMKNFKQSEKEWKPKSWKSNTWKDPLPGTWPEGSNRYDPILWSLMSTNSRDKEKVYWYNGKIHRDDGPAIIYSSGIKEWWVLGVRHRTDGPAIEYPDGTKFWIVRGVFHKTDGPAVEWGTTTHTNLPDKKDQYFLYGKECTEEMYKTLTQGPVEQTLLLFGQGFDKYIEERLKG